MKYFLFPKIIKKMINRLKLGISNIKYWLKVIWNDRQYDFGFIYVIELRKIQRMIKWWSSEEPITEKELILRDLRICEYLLKVIIGEIDYTTAIESTTPLIGYSYRFNHYINTRNGKRFLKVPEKLDKNHWVYLNDLYIEKCRNLYYLIRNYKIETWWD